MQVRPEGLKIPDKCGEFAPRHRPLRDMWLRVLDLFVRVLTLGAARVMPVDRLRDAVKWDGVIR